MIAIPMPIFTSRLMLRPIEVMDAEDVYAYKKESWPELLKWMIWVHPPSIEDRTIEDEQKFCAYFHEKFVRREDIVCLAFCRKTNNLIGSGSLRQCNWRIPMFTLGFTIRTHESGKGYGTEIGTSLTRYAFDALSAKKVAVFHADGNIGSQRVIEKIGFEKEGVLRRQHVLPDGSIVDEHHYGLLDKAHLPDIQVEWGVGEGN